MKIAFLMLAEINNVLYFLDANKSILKKEIQSTKVIFVIKTNYERILTQMINVV